jgi:predicted nucleic acid-binding protein
MLIVCDSSPLFALAICNQLELLDKLYDTIILPDTVYAEISVSGKPHASDLAAWGKGRVVSVTNEELCKAFNLLLDRGEAEAMTLYKEKSADLLLIDEHKGRKIAEMYEIKIVGTLGILLKAKQEMLIPEIKSSIEILQKSTIRISGELYHRALEVAQER